MKNLSKPIPNILTIEVPSSMQENSPKSSATLPITEGNPEQWLSILAELSKRLNALSVPGLEHTPGSSAGTRGLRISLFAAELSRIDSDTGGLFSIELTVSYRKL